MVHLDILIASQFKKQKIFNARHGPASQPISNSYTMGCPPVRGDNPRALANGLSYVQVD